LAEASNVLHRPSDDIILARDVRIDPSALSVRFTPPANAMLASPLRRLWTAQCNATNDEEQAVSIAAFGP
jgi:hypothetical protein